MARYPLHVHILFIVYCGDDLIQSYEPNLIDRLPDTSFYEGGKGY